ncbi:hypothetical protein PPYR_01574 [Photinus pyralis]|uniref:Uncharacterized protein n=1 Tax=Photinus pyralis TaxID=7054 RepID=A0A5N4B4X3_PHOPY|nr:hypothetical protein PPYR_01574 [Photinus pyralis]
MALLRHLNVNSDSDDEMLEGFLQKTRARKRFRQLITLFDEYNDDEFFMRFRLTKPTVAALHEQLVDQIKFQTNRNNGLSSLNQLLLALRFYACGNMLITVGDFTGVQRRQHLELFLKCREQLQHFEKTLLLFRLLMRNEGNNNNSFSK